MIYVISIHDMTNFQRVFSIMPSKSPKNAKNTKNSNEIDRNETDHVRINLKRKIAEADESDELVRLLASLSDISIDDQSDEADSDEADSDEADSDEADSDEADSDDQKLSDVDLILKMISYLDPQLQFSEEEETEAESRDHKTFKFDRSWQMLFLKDEILYIKESKNHISVMAKTDNQYSYMYYPLRWMVFKKPNIFDPILICQIEISSYASFIGAFQFNRHINYGMISNEMVDHYLKEPQDFEAVAVKHISQIINDYEAGDLKKQN